MELRNQYVLDIGRAQSNDARWRKTRSNSGRQRGFLPSMCTPRRGTTPRVTRSASQRLSLLLLSILVLCAMALGALPATSQIPVPNSQPLPPGQSPNTGSQIRKFAVDVNLVVLHTTVLDDRGRFADGLKRRISGCWRTRPNRSWPSSSAKTSRSAWAW